jgi:hypothetical protein
VTTVIVIIVVLVIIALLAGAFLARKRQEERRRAELQERFGPEYTRAVDESGSQREAERHLAEVAHKRDKLEIRDLSAAERGRYTDEWDVVQSRFVDEPAAAVDSAESLIHRVMRERGYPVEDFDEQADLVAADHPGVVSEYRAAHEAHQRHRSSGSLDTEDLRQAFVHYRTLFGSLVNPETVAAPTTGSTTGSTGSTGSTATVGAPEQVRDATADDVATGRPAGTTGAADADPAPTGTDRAAGTRGARAVSDDSYHTQETR